MKNIICVLFVFYNLCSCLYGADVVNIASVAKNFAEAILFPSEYGFLAVFSNKVYVNGVRPPESEYNPLKDDKYEEYCSKNFPVRTFCEIDIAFCVKPNPILFLKKEYHSISMKNRPVPVIQKSKWVAVLRSPYKPDSDELDIRNPRLLKLFEGIERFKFINKETFFEIPTPQYYNALCLEWPIDAGFDLPSEIASADQKLLEDLKKFSTLFCGKALEFLDGIESINKSMPSLQSDFGKLIANKMIEILETKVIDAAKAK